MEQFKPELLDLMVQPAFIVEGQTITRVNNAAARLLIQEGVSLDLLLKTGQAEYADFKKGSLYVTLDIFGVDWGACVSQTTQGTVFLLDQSSKSNSLQLLALAARELRGPLSDAMITAQQAAHGEDPRQRENAAHLTQKLYQILRLVSNMSDASGSSTAFCPELRRMDALFREIFEKAGSMTETAGFPLTFEGLEEEVAALADQQQLERAVLNLISNAMKFSPKGSTILGRLTKRGNFLHLQIINHGEGIPAEILPTVFQRHLRQPTIEDSRFGIGLGLLLVRNTAANHGGCVLIDQPAPDCTRVTMTIAIRSDLPRLNSPLHVDYAGELDHVLIELSDNLSPNAYFDL